MSNLNKKQFEAVETVNGPVVIIAGPGTGKTKTLVERTVNILVNKEVEAKKIMITTFTNKAAKELELRINERLEELKGSLEAVKSFVPDVVKAGFNGIFVTITNPVDIVTYFVRELSGFPKNRVIGTGTGLDSARLKRILSEVTNIDSQVIQAYMLGEHGDTQVANFSSATIQGVPFLGYMKSHPEQFKGIELSVLEKQVVRTAWDIISGKNCTEFGIGCTCSNLVKAIFHNERRVLPCSAYLEGEYGYSGFYTGVPAIIGSNGVEEILELPLNERERKGFEDACAVMKKYIEIGKSYRIV